MKRKKAWKSFQQYNRFFLKLNKSENKASKWKFDVSSRLFCENEILDCENFFFPSSNFISFIFTRTSHEWTEIEWKFPSLISFRSWKVNNFYFLTSSAAIDEKNKLFHFECGAFVLLQKPMNCVEDVDGEKTRDACGGWGCETQKMPIIYVFQVRKSPTQHPCKLSYQPFKWSMEIFINNH